MVAALQEEVCGNSIHRGMVNTSKTDEQTVKDWFYPSISAPEAPMPHLMDMPFPVGMDVRLRGRCLALPGSRSGVLVMAAAMPLRQALPAAVPVP